MRALTATPAGLELRDALRPPEPPPGHVVVRVTAAHHEGQS
ncbi:hypothetical protein [Streptomyces sp. 5-10]|nr:hypothetical protein [Streptomyces sp. 5-10]